MAAAAESGAQPALLLVGRINRAHGLKGEVIVDLTSNRLERTQPGTRFETVRGPLVIGSAAAHQGKWRVQFDGVVGRDAAEALRGVELHAEPLDVPGELWVHELLGATVALADGTVVGTVQAVEDNPASDLLVLEGDRLVPLTFVIAHEPGRLVIDPPAGLLDLQD